MTNKTHDLNLNPNDSGIYPTTLMSRKEINQDIASMANMVNYRQKRMFIIDHNYRFSYADDRKDFNRWLSAPPPSAAIIYRAPNNGLADLEIMMEIFVSGKKLRILKEISFGKHKDWRHFVAYIIREMRRDLYKYAKSPQPPR